MPQTKHDELKAGLFVIIALAVTLGVILWLGAGDAFRTAGQEVVPIERISSRHGRYAPR